ncbi:RHS repeat-associated core domain protein [Saprospira grandis DSM 2844]|uniref:RHS repeat-associated core domain protein n=1 Tax=Saprospira grandis DSM 2844 TaxID=694433 RepID=J1I8Q7_9BACT|nr:RHS repeat-associated core domain-containing protein [Saprospira grandis]EJF54853.1 RHS repeat-associated core domain protein [Saprospira grandis DSM 2844]
MVRDSSEQIEKIVWTVQGKVQEVHFEAGKPGPSVLQYEYDPMGNRLAKKKLYVDGPVDIRSEGQYYVRDPQGNVLAVYQYNEENIALVDDKDSLYLEELHLYGSARLGILKKPLFLRFRNESGHTGGDEALAFRTLMGVAQSSYQQLELGRRRYELSNHLGNVLATVSDKSLGQDSSQTGQADYYLAQVSSASLYYPFGWEMPGRKFVSGEGCRFGFNGKEDDRDWGTQNIQDYGFRLYNPSIGKFLSVDPLAKSFPWNSCYAFAEGDVVRSVDLDGLEKEFYYTMDKGQKPILKSVSYGDSPMDSEGNREVHVVDYFDDLGYKLGQAVHHSVDELES